MLLNPCFYLRKFFSLGLFLTVVCLTAFTVLGDYPIASQHYAADPTGVEFNGRIYVYCSNDEENYTNSYTMASIACFSTDDLKNWTDHGAVFRVPQNASWASLTWAPSAVVKNKKIYLYFANGAGSIGVATSTDPAGPFMDAKGSALVNSSTPGASTSTQWLFDPCAFIDDDGQSYLYFGGQYPTNARVILLNSNLTAVSGSAQPMFATNLFEASYMHKRGSTYYYTYCNRFAFGAAIYCETNSNPTNGFMPSGVVLANPPDNVNNNNHHSIFSFQGNWYIAYHNRAAALQNGLSDADAVYKRSICLDQINYNADGSIQQVSPTTDGLPQLKYLNPYNRVEGETIAQQSGIKTEVCSEGGMDVTSITSGCWIRVRGVNFGNGASTFFARVASAGNGGNIELHLDSLNGTLIGDCAVSPTGEWQTWTTATCPVSGALGVHDLYLKFTGITGDLFNLNWWKFQPTAISTGTATINSATTFQTIEGLGGATAFYAGWIKDHPYRLEIYTNAFAGLNLSMLRLGNWFRYQNTANFDSAASDIVSNANRVLGHSVPVMMSSWSPPAFLKSNGDVANGGTLVMTNGGFAYTNFANYWFDSLLSYRSNGVSPTWISIQNEPDFIAPYDSCVFRPTEGVYNGTNYASYSSALNATFRQLTNLPSPPKLLAPEVVGLGYSAVQNYAVTLNANSFYGLAHHLYGGSTDGTPDGYKATMSALTNLFRTKPRFMTEYGVTNMIEAAWLIHNVLTIEQASGYNFWSLIWPYDGVGLVQIENPYSQSSWTNAPPGTGTQTHGWWLAPSYWAMKHFSYFITPGYKRVAASCADTNVLASAYLSPDNLRLVAVFINKSTNAFSAVTANFGFSPLNASSVYQTTEADKFLSLGPVGSQLALPPSSLTTVVLDKSVTVGQAANPSPANNAIGVALSATLSWSAGINALTHAIYLGINSNAVAQATTVSMEFQGILTTNFFTAPSLAGSRSYYWRVDEIAGDNTNTGAVWSFNTVLEPSLAHRYSFSETSGSVVADSVGGAAWNGALPKGGTFSGGQLILSSNLQQYVNLPANILTNTTAVTIEAWATFPTSLPWASWFFGFGNTNGSAGRNYLFCSPGGGRFAVTGVSPGYLGETNAYTSGLSWSGKTLHITCVFNPPEGYLAIYTNGVLAGTNTSGTYTMNSIANNLGFINRSLYSADPYINLTLDEFRIYKAALSPAEIAATEVLGPDQLLNDDSPSISINQMPANLTFSWPLASAGFRLQSRTNLAQGDWMDVTSPAPQIIGGQWQMNIAPSSNSGSTFYRLVK